MFKGWRYCDWVDAGTEGDFTEQITQDIQLYTVMTVDKKKR